MGTVTYGKKGSVSKKSHATKSTGCEYAMDRYSPVPAMGSGKKTAPDHMTRRMGNVYGKSMKKMPMSSKEMDDMEDMGEMED